MRRPPSLNAIAQALRALLAGGAATLADLAVLGVLVSFVHLAPRVANVPALVVGGLVSFFANRGFVFRAPSGGLVHQARQVALFAIVEIIALALNGVLFDVAMRAFAAHPGWYGPVRLVTSHIVFLGWSYPLWHFVFRRPLPTPATE